VVFTTVQLKLHYPDYPKTACCKHPIIDLQTRGQSFDLSFTYSY